MQELINLIFENAHDAIADVEVTMKLMKMLVQRNSDLFNNFIENSSTKNVEKKYLMKIYLLYIIIYSIHTEYI